MNRAQLLIAMPVSTLVALLFLALVAWITSGDWSPGRVRLIDLALVLPMLGAVHLGLERGDGLVVCFVTYWAITFAAFVVYVVRTR